MFQYESIVGGAIDGSWRSGKRGCGWRLIEKEASALKIARRLHIHNY